MMTLAEGMHGGLGALAEALQVERIGPMHQAGSDSLLTAQTFFSLITKQFGGICDDTKYVSLTLFIGHFSYYNIYVCLVGSRVNYMVSARITPNTRISSVQIMV